VDLGFRRQPEKVDLTLLNQLIGTSSFGAGRRWRLSRSGQTFNVNADTFAGAVAGALKQAAIAFDRRSRRARQSRSLFRNCR